MSAWLPCLAVLVLGACGGRSRVDSGVPEDVDAGLDAGMQANAGSPDGGLANDAGTDAGVSDAGWGHCVPAASPRILVDDPGFECGGGTWLATAGTLTMVADAHTGHWAAQVTADTLGAALAPKDVVVSDGGIDIFCFTAWVKGTVPFLTYRVLRNDLLGGAEEFDFKTSVTNTWQRVPPSIIFSVQSLNNTTLRLALEAQMTRSDGGNAQPGQVLLVDDVDVWHSASGKCDEVRP
jgi:hypothetical protein